MIVVFSCLLLSWWHHLINDINYYRLWAMPSLSCVLYWSSFDWNLLFVLRWVFTSCFCAFFKIIRMQLLWLLLGACLWLLYITEVRTATFKLALIGPWSCDPMFSRAMPTAAANLALSRLRSDSSLSRGYRYNIKLLEEHCSTSKGLSE